MNFTFLRSCWTGLIVSLPLILITLTSYLSLKSLKSKYRVPLVALRGLAILILTLALLRPTLIFSEKVRQKPDLILLVDASRSMSVQEGNERRIDLVKRKLSDEFLKRLSDRFELHRYSFGSSLKALGRIESLEPDEDSTEIISTIRSIIDAWRGRPLVGIVLLSDGVDTSGEASPQELPVPIYAFGVGSSAPPKDIRVVSVSVPPISYVDHVTPVRILIENRGYDGKRIQVTLRDNELREVTRKLVELRSRMVRVEFKIKPSVEGNFTYTVSLPTLPGEISSKNNSKVFLLKVVKSKLRVLAIESTLRWEFTFLKRALERDPNIEPSYFIIPRRKPPGTIFQNRRSIPVENGLDRFPSLGELMRYDVLVIGDLDSTSLSSSEFDSIVRYVSSGGGAIFLPGKSAMGARGLVKTPLARLLPISIPQQGCILRSEEFNPVLTLEGMYHPAMRMGRTKEENLAIWENLPALKGLFTGFSPKPGASILAEYRAETALPVVLFQRYGSGKVLFLGGVGVWGWDFKVWGALSGLPKGGNTPYRRFWSQAIRWIGARATAKLVSASLEKRIFQVGEEGKVTAHVYDETFSPVKGAQVKVILQTPYGKDLPLEVEEVEGVKGVYTSTYRFLREGSYRFIVEARYGGAVLGRDSVGCEVQRPTLEFERPYLDETLLRRLAEISGGKYLKVEDLDRLPGIIKAEDKFLTVQREKEIWDTPLLLVIVTTILSAEWILRKRRDLI